MAANKMNDKITQTEADQMIEILARETIEALAAEVTNGGLADVMVTIKWKHDGPPDTRVGV